VEPLVLGGEAADVLRGLADAGAALPPELVGDGEDQHGEGVLVAGLGGEDVEADALGLLRLVEEPVLLRPLDGLGDGRRRDGLELKVVAHAPPPPWRRIVTGETTDSRHLPPRAPSAGPCRRRVARLPSPAG